MNVLQAVALGILRSKAHCMIILSALTFSGIAQQEQSCYQHDHAYITGTMNVRENATTRSAIIVKVVRGSEFAVLGSEQGNTYCWIELDEGWMAVTAYVTDRFTAILPEISGDQSFIDSVKDAFALLNNKSPRYFEYVASRINQIISDSNLGVGDNGNPVNARVLVRTGALRLNPSFLRTWDTAFVASALVHEACHVKQWNDGKRATLFDFAGAWKLERECYRVEAHALTKISPGHPEIKGLRCYARRFPSTILC